MSMRINEDRLAGPIEETTEVNNDSIGIATGATDLKFITPTEFVELPSRGQFYPPTHPLHNQDVVEIKHLTTKEEDILTSVTLLRKGIALERMLQNIIVDKRIKVEDLLLGDKSALIVAARLHGYGSEYSTTITCVQCEERQKYTFELDSLKLHFPEEKFTTEHQIVRTDSGTFLFPLPKTQYTIEVRFLTAADEKRLVQNQEHRKKKNFPEASTSDFLRSIIVSVNSVCDEASINEFISTLPALQARYIRKMYEELLPTLDMTHPFNCISCGHEGVMEVPLTTDFFWSDTRVY